MSEDDEIIHTVLENFTCEDPADPNDPEAWHFTDKEVRAMLGICIETVRERMLDPVEVGKQIGQLSLELDSANERAANSQAKLVTEQKCRQEERDHWLRELDIVRAERAHLKQERDEAFAVADTRTKQWAQTVAISDIQRREYAKLKQEMADAMQTIHDQAEIIERLEARQEAPQGLLIASESNIIQQEDNSNG